MTAGWLSLGWVVAPVLHLYRVNAGSFPSSAVIRPLLLLVLLHLLLYGALRRRLRDDRSGALLSCFWAVFFLFSHLEHPLRTLLPGVAEPWVPWLLAGLTAVVLGSGWRSTPVSFPWRALTFAGAALGAIQLALFIPSFFSPSTLSTWTSAQSSPAPANPTFRTPNIYYIVLDGYARQDVLARRYRFDNEPFLRCLEADGFQVLRKSSPNYSHTVLSLASSLNMDYLQSFNLPLEGESDLKLIKPLLSRNLVLKELRKFGYRFVTLESGYELTELKDADRYLRTSSRLTEFEMGLLQTTPLGRNPDSASLSQWKTHHRRVLGSFRALEELAADPGPRFIFAHIVCPHPPFVFDSEGRFLDRTPGLFMASGSDLVRPGLMGVEELAQRRGSYRRHRGDELRRHGRQRHRQGDRARPA